MNVLRCRSGCSTLSAAAQRLKMRTSPKWRRPNPSQSMTNTCVEINQSSRRRDDGVEVMIQPWSEKRREIWLVLWVFT